MGDVEVLVGLGENPAHVADGQDDFLAAAYAGYYYGLSLLRVLKPC